MRELTNEEKEIEKNLFLGNLKEARKTYREILFRYNTIVLKYAELSPTLDKIKKWVNEFNSKFVPLGPDKIAKNIEAKQTAEGFLRVIEKDPNFLNSLKSRRDEADQIFKDIIKFENKTIKPLKDRKKAFEFLNKVETMEVEANELKISIDEMSKRVKIYSDGCEKIYNALSDFIPRLERAISFAPL